MWRSAHMRNAPNTLEMLNDICLCILFASPIVPSLLPSINCAAVCGTLRESTKLIYCSMARAVMGEIDAGIADDDTKKTSNQMDVFVAKFVRQRLSISSAATVVTVLWPQFRGSEE